MVCEAVEQEGCSLLIAMRDLLVSQVNCLHMGQLQWNLASVTFDSADHVSCQFILYCNAGRPATTSRRPSKPLRRANPDPASDGGEGAEEGSGASSEEDPNAPPGEAGRKRSRSGRGTPKRKRRHRLAVVKGGWNEEDDAKLTRSEFILFSST